MLKFVEKRTFTYCAGLLFFFAFVHYSGYVLDAVLYLLQVVNYLYPERFVNDVPFMFGNQDSFTIYSPIVAKVFELFNVDLGGRLLTFCLQFFWGIGAICFIEKWCNHFGCRKWSLPVFVAFLLAMTTKRYGCGPWTLPIVEPILMARFFSEIFVFFALAFFFHKNKYISLLFFVGSALIHPLMCGWGLPLWLFYHYPRTKLPVVAVSLLFPLTAFLHIGKLDFYPNDWLVKPYSLTPDWKDFLVYSGYLLFWMTMYRQLNDSKVSKFSISMFVVVSIALYFQYVGAFAGHIFLYQVQPYRAQWMCAIATVPTFVLFMKENFVEQHKNYLKNYACVALGLCAIAQTNWFVALIALSTIVYSPIGKKEIANFDFQWKKTLFYVAFVVLISSVCVENFVEMALQQGVGSSYWAIKLMDAPEYIAPVKSVFLFALTMICVIERKWWFSFAFALSFCNSKFQILPIASILLYFAPNLRSSIKQVVVAATIALSFVEILESLEKSALWSACFIVILFPLSYLAVRFLKTENTKKWTVLASTFLVVFITWDVHSWDAREDFEVLNERQMESFLDEPIFPQVKDRGKLLFVVDNEGPLQSRFNFLTGAYADASIYVGDIFYKGQYLESNRRRTALLTGDTKPVSLEGYENKVHLVYTNLDTLHKRVGYLCSIGDITHLATDYSNMNLVKVDSSYLDVKRKFVYLYQCD